MPSGKYTIKASLRTLSCCESDIDRFCKVFLYIFTPLVCPLLEGKQAKPQFSNATKDSYLEKYASSPRNARCFFFVPIHRGSKLSIEIVPHISGVLRLNIEMRFLKYLIRNLCSCVQIMVFQMSKARNQL